MVWVLTLNRDWGCGCISYLLGWELIIQGEFVGLRVVQFCVYKWTHIFNANIQTLFCWYIRIVEILLPLVPSFIYLDLLNRILLVATLVLEPGLCPFVLVLVYNETISGRVADQVLLVQLLHSRILRVLYLVWGGVRRLWLIDDWCHIMPWFV